MEPENKKINKGADAITEFLGLKGPFLIGFFVIFGISFIMFNILNSLSDIPILVKWPVPIGFFLIAVFLLRYASSKYGVSGLDKLGIRDKTTKIYQDHSNPFENI